MGEKPSQDQGSGRASASARLLSPRVTANVRQAIKTGIAGVASLYLSKFLNLPEGYWAVLSAVIVMQSSVGAAVSDSRNRLAGTAIGAAVGGIFVVLWGANALSFGLAVTFTVLICAFLSLLESYRLASATVAIVMLVHGAAPAWIIALHRFLEVSLGIVVALLVNVLVWPSRARENLRRGIVRALGSLAALYEAVVRRYNRDPHAAVDQLMSQVNDTLRANEDLRKQAAYEPVLGAARQEWPLLFLDRMHPIFLVIESLELATRDSSRDTYHLKFEPELRPAMDAISAAFQRLAVAVASRRIDPRWPNLAGLASSLEEKAAGMRKMAVAGHSLEEILRFYSFLLGLKNLSRELDLAATALARLLPPARYAD